MPEFHMVQLTFDSRGLERQRRGHGLPARSSDLDYLVHGQLMACFGELAPKPFRVRDRRGRVEVLGYAKADEPALKSHVQAFAEPRFSCSLLDVATKRMPERWSRGQRLGFEVRVCPVVRLAKRGPGGEKKGAEVDAFLRACWQVDPNTPVARDTVYADWLRDRVGEAADLRDVMLERFDLPRVHRKGAPRDGGRRRQTIARPDALLKGELTVRDPDAFSALLRRGIGRHRAFGFGLLLLRPPGSR